MRRHEVSIFVVLVDLLICFLFILAVYRVKYLETRTDKDLRSKQLRVDDFTVHLKDIPVDPSDYDNNPELLTAMLVTHLEDICKTEI